MHKQVLIVDDEETLTWSLAKSLAVDRDTGQRSVRDRRRGRCSSA